MAGRITLGQQFRYATDYFVGADRSGEVGTPYNKSSNLYLPASSAGAPSISPTYDTLWQDVTSAVRVVGRFGKKYGTSLESDSQAHTVINNTHLSRQFVIPVAGIGLFHPSLGDNCAFSANGAIGSLTILASVSNADSQIDPMASIYIVDSGGSKKNLAHTVSGVTITAAGVLTKTGGFSPSDVGRLFVVEAHDNYVLGFGFQQPNQIQSYVNSGKVNAQAYNGRSGAPGTNRTIRYIGEDGRSTVAFALGGTNSTSDTPVAINFGDVGSYSSDIVETDYLVIEVGYGIISPNSTPIPSRNYRLKYRDDHDDILPVGGGATGAIPIFSSLAPVLSLSGL